MKNQIAILLFLSNLILISCAGVKIYSDANLQHPTAVQFHYAKPYLLVEHNSNKDGTTKTSIVYLPDQTETYYAKMVSGLGNSDLKIAFENGSIASLGISSDNKILLSTGSLSSLIGDLAKSPTPLTTDKKTDATIPEFELYQIIVIDGKTSLKKLEWKK